MGDVIKTLDVENGDLFFTTNGQRRNLAGFTGRIEISEDRIYVPIMNVPHKGLKNIHAAIILCGDLRYRMDIKPDTIHSGNVYSATGMVNGSKLIFDGLRFEDSDPIANELIFEITDYRLIESLLRR